jgi:hypothetical protein
VHHISIKAGDNIVRVDPEFDAAVHLSDAGIALRYTSRAARDERALKDGAALANVLGASRVVLLMVESVVVRVVPGRAVDGWTPAHVAFRDGRYDDSALARVARALATETRDEGGSL